MWKQWEDNGGKCGEQWGNIWGNYGRTMEEQTMKKHYESNRRTMVKQWRDNGRTIVRTMGE